MLILTVRTDNPEAEIGLYDDTQRVDYISWHAHRELADTIHLRIKELLDKHGYTFEDIKGIVGFKGPGSFTGLRIGLTVVNTLGYALAIPVVATEGDSWIALGVNRIQNNDADPVALPEYGALPNITKPKH